MLVSLKMISGCLNIIFIHGGGCGACGSGGGGGGGGGDSRSNPEVVGSIPTEVKIFFLYLVWFPVSLY